MSVVTFPIENADQLGAFNFTAVLDEVEFRFHFRFNEREGFWYFDISNLAGVPLRSGVKCVVNFPVIRLMSLASRPKGEILILDTRNNPQDPGLTDLGVFGIFTYVLQDQVPQ